MQNVANVPPPDYISVNGTDYQCHTDFLVWADIVTLAQAELFDRPAKPEDVLHNWQVLAEMQRKAFNRVLPEPHLETWRAMLEFMRGFPRAQTDGNREEDGDGAKTFSLKHDMNMIVLAIRNQSGIDLRYNEERLSFHWWLFLLEFQTLDDSHLIVNIMRWRAYDGEDKELMRRRERVALPQEYTKSELALLAEVEEMFPNT